MRTDVRDFAQRVNEAFSSDIAFLDHNLQNLHIPRFSTGILSLDLATGGGLPFNRISLLTGMESTAKTFLLLKAIEQISLYDHETKLPYYLAGKDFQPGTCLYVDAECSFDLDWAKRCANFDEEHHLLVRPETGEQVSDIVTMAIEENQFDLIVIDSIEAMVPKKEYEDSADQNQMGKRALMVNQCWRKWLVGLSKTSHSGFGPAVVAINQIRDSMALFGSSETLPGGKGQLFAPSICIRMQAPKIKDGAEKETAYGDFGGVVKKNKTYTPKKNFQFRTCLTEGEEVPIGYINNIKELFDAGVRHGLIDKGPPVKFGKWETKAQKDMKELLESDKEVMHTLWASVVKEETGYWHGKFQDKKANKGKKEAVAGEKGNGKVASK